MRTTHTTAMGLGLATLIGIAACGGGGDDGGTIAQLSAARSGTMTANACTALGTFTAANTVIDSVTNVAAGTVSGQPVGEHCLVAGRMYPNRAGTNGTYAIGFEMRLPLTWNGRFFYQGNGGLDGAVVPAVGMAGPTSALTQGFAVISSDAGHSGAQNGAFGFDPQARLDYGYQAAQKLTPVGKALIAAAYGRGPDRSYFGGCSNGGRHTLVATARLGNEYDGFLAGAPGYNLPKAAVSQVWGTQQYATIMTPGATTTAPSFLGSFTIPDLSTAFTAAERQLVSSRILAKCDALDMAADGIVSDTASCQKAFSLADDVPTCSGSRDGTCLTGAQKTAIAGIFSGAKTTSGTAIYNSFPYDPGLAGNDWAAWEFTLGLLLDPLAVGTVFRTPPAPIADSLTVSIDTLVSEIAATSGNFTESSLSFMTPPNPAELSTLKRRGAKVMVYHGVSDAVFSYDDTVTWYKNLQAANSGDASTFARFFGVPGMNHCSSGPSTDEFDMLTPLIEWVEQGKAPDSVIASARASNTELPATWSASRTRPLCPWPKVARYKGAGSLEEAANFSCQ